MSLDLGSYLDSLRTSAAHASPALLALIFLVTPTAIWIAYRLMFGRSGKRMPKSTIAYLWGCPICHSANQPADQTCYGCGSRIDRFATVTLIDAVTMQAKRVRAQWHAAAIAGDHHAFAQQGAHLRQRRVEIVDHRARRSAGPEAAIGIVGTLGEDFIGDLQPLRAARLDEA